MIAGTLNLKEGFADYLALELGLSDNTVRTHLYSLLRIERFCGKHVREVTSSDLRTFLRDSPATSKTKELTVTALRGFHRWGHMEELWPLNGITEVRGPKVTMRTRRGLSTSPYLGVS